MVLFGRSSPFVSTIIIIIPCSGSSLCYWGISNPWYSSCSGNTEFSFWFLWFPRASPELNGHCPWKVNMKAHVLQWQVAGLYYVLAKHAKETEGTWKWWQDNSPWTPLDYGDITLISMIIRMIASIWLTFPINDSIMLLCGVLSSRLFFTDFKLFLKILQGLRNYKNPLVSRSYIIDLIDLVPHSSFLKNFFLEVICY